MGFHTCCILDEEREYGLKFGRERYDDNVNTEAEQHRRMQLLVSTQMGEKLDGELKRLVSKRKIALDTRGRGLLRALIIDDAQKPGELAYDVCLAMRDRGVLAKPTHGNIIRLAPPLVIDDAQLDAAVSSLDEALALWD